jgi:hypothetical protein
MNGIDGLAPKLTLPVVVSAALVDSINPCAFAVLLTFIAGTLVLAERASARVPTRAGSCGGWALCMWPASF